MDYDELDYELDKLIDNELNNSNINKYISLINLNLDLKYNSLNIAVGKPGTSKTTTFMKAMMKLSQFPNSYHMILYVSDSNADETILSLLKFVSIPMIRITYGDFLNKFVELVKLKQEYWKALGEKIRK